MEGVEEEGEMTVIVPQSRKLHFVTRGRDLYKYFCRTDYMKLYHWCQCIH